MLPISAYDPDPIFSSADPGSRSASKQMDPKYCSQLIVRSLDLVLILSGRAARWLFSSHISLKWLFFKAVAEVAYVA